MCEPSTITMAVGAVVSATTAVIAGIETKNQQDRNSEYRKQVAINNIKNADKQAKAAAQEGIEYSRKERLSGIREKNKLISQSAASGFDLNSDTNLLNFDDPIKNSNMNAEYIQDQYKYKSDSYMEKANSYLDEYKNSESNYNSKQYLNALNRLNDTANISLKWFRKDNNANI